MATNITITIPNDLHDRLQKVKKQFNISKACQDAIEVEVNRQELLMKGLENMEDVITRLRAEKTEYIKQYFDIGYKEGSKDCRKFTYIAFVALCGLNPDKAVAVKINELDNYSCAICALLAPYLSHPHPDDEQSELIADRLFDEIEDIEIMCENPEMDVDDSLPCSRELALYAQGWLKAIQDFYGQIKDQL